MKTIAERIEDFRESTRDFRDLPAFKLELGKSLNEINLLSILHSFFVRPLTGDEQGEINNIFMIAGNKMIFHTPRKPYY